MTHSTYELAPGVERRPSAGAHVSLIFLWAEELRAVALREGESLVVGRAEPARIIIEDRSLSRMHARVSMFAGGVHIEDLGSTNGIRLNGRRSPEALVDEGDLLMLGAVEMRVSSPLTGTRLQARAISPHAAWMERLAEELARSQLFARQGAVIAARHPAEVPIDSLLDLLRPIDRVCRYTPHIVLVSLPELAPAAAAAWAERLQASASRELALGIAVFPSDAGSAESLVSLAIAAAQRAQFGRPAQRVDAVAEPVEHDAPVVACEPMQRLYGLVSRVARTTLPVLVTGETGTGKELVARALHEQSPRSRARFKALNCATLPGGLIESALFGYERGSFTGADRQTLGLFEQAQGGTILLDEVGELAPQAQSALLRVLEQKHIVRIGGSKETAVDVRVIAATHRDLSAMVALGSFREDLLFRLNALTLRVPPLRERRSEIAPLSRLFLTRARRQWGGSAQEISEEALEALEDFEWPGNVRQLRNVIERAVAMCQGTQIELEDLPEQLCTDAPSTATVAPLLAKASAESASEDTRSLGERVREFEVAIIQDALERAQGNQSMAARMLQLPRRTFANKVLSHGLRWTRRPSEKT